jgi:hypothetical protein
MITEKLIETHSNENGFLFGTDVVMQVLRPNAIYCLNVEGGNFKIVSWDESNEQDPPSSQEIREEYIRHQTIYEVLEYLKNKEK